MHTVAPYDREMHGGIALSVDRGRAPVAIGGTARTGLRLLGQGVILCLLFGVGTALAGALSLPLPGNLVGMLLLLLLLGTGTIRLGHVQELAEVAVKHLNFFFIPFVVGLMAWGALLSTSGLALAISLIGSAVVGLVVAGGATQLTASRGDSPDAP